MFHRVVSSLGAETLSCLLLLSLAIISTWYEQWGWGVGGELVSGFIINPMKGAETIV